VVQRLNGTETELYADSVVTCNIQCWELILFSC